MLAYVLLRLARIWGDDELERRGVSVLRLVRDALAALPTAFGWMLVALDQHLAPHRELAIVGDRDAPVARAALEQAAPTDVIAFGPADDVPLLAGRTEVDGRTAVYLCERFACALPVTDPADRLTTGSSSAPRPRAAPRSPARRPPPVDGRLARRPRARRRRDGSSDRTERVADAERQHAEPGAERRARRRGCAMSPDQLSTCDRNQFECGCIRRAPSRPRPAPAGTRAGTSRADARCGRAAATARRRGRRRRRCRTRPSSRPSRAGRPARRARASSPAAAAPSERRAARVFHPFSHLVASFSRERERGLGGATV